MWRTYARGLCLLTFVMFPSTAIGQSAPKLGVVTQTAPMFSRPGMVTPLVVLEVGVDVKVVRVEGPWVNITVEDPRWGTRVGYVELKRLRLQDSVAPGPAAVAVSVPTSVVASPVATPVASVPTVAVAVPVASAPAPVSPPTPAPVASATPVPSSPRPVTTVPLNRIRRIYLEKMDNDLDQYIAAEITKQFKGKLSVVLDRGNADAILRGIGENRTGVGAAITGRYLGLHDNASASVTLVDPGETVVLWASEAGDRSLFFGVAARGGQRKVASRLVDNLKGALEHAK